MSLYQDRIFPRLLAWTSAAFDEDRAALMAEAVGRVLELGVGTGANLGFYPPEVTDVVGMDPHEAVLGHALGAARRLERERPGGLPYRVRIQRGDAQQMPYDDASFDTVVAFLTLCSVPDPLAAARESHRVLRPGGRLLVLEHVQAPPGSWLRGLQHVAGPVWTRLAGGCHLDRDTASVLSAAGFDARPLERYRDQLYFPLTAERIRGVLHKPV